MLPGDVLSGSPRRDPAHWLFVAPLRTRQTSALLSSPVPSLPLCGQARALWVLEDAVPLGQKQILPLEENQLQAAWCPTPSGLLPLRMDGEIGPDSSPMSLSLKVLSFAFWCFQFLLRIWNWKAECSSALVFAYKPDSRETLPIPVPPCPPPWGENWHLPQRPWGGAHMPFWRLPQEDSGRG